ncbi:MAG: SPOR domain-containing protein [Micavibrio sp.]|nr:SPOR domain-containing protein [Micavibrio sp.]
MNQNNNYQQQYDFDHYDRMPLGEGLGARKPMAKFGRMMKSPMAMTAGVLLVGVAFAAIMISSFSDGDAVEAPAVIKAETTAFKQMPSVVSEEDVDAGNSIFMSMNDESIEESAPVENLLEVNDDEDRLAAFYEQVEKVVEEDEAAISDKLPTGGKIENLLANADGQDVKDNDALAMVKDAAKIKDADAAMDSEVPAPAEDTLAEAPTDETTLASAEPAPVRKPITHSAGSNPETLEYVRSVLEKKDGMAAARAEATVDHTASSANSVEPAAGTPASAEVTPGSYYVQVGSVSSATGASSEWGKIQKAFPSQLGGLDHRVTTADLGARGTFYRIQAGPMSKESASSICDSMKSQKPGACLVTQ